MGGEPETIVTGGEPVASKATPSGEPAASVDRIPDEFMPLVEKKRDEAVQAALKRERERWETEQAEAKKKAEMTELERAQMEAKTASTRLAELDGELKYLKSIQTVTRLASGVPDEFVGPAVEAALTAGGEFNAEEVAAKAKERWAAVLSASGTSNGVGGGYRRVPSSGGTPVTGTQPGDKFARMTGAQVTAEMRVISRTQGPKAAKEFNEQYRAFVAAGGRTLDR